MAEIFGIQAAFAFARVADLHQEFSVMGELQALIVILADPGIAAIAANPDIVLAVHSNAMLLHWPVEYGTLALAHRQHAAPAQNETTNRGENNHRRRRTSAHVI